jgi:hypothetical protein
MEGTHTGYADLISHTSFLDTLKAVEEEDYGKIKNKVGVGADRHLYL